MAKRPKRNQTAAHVVLTEMRVRSGRRSRKLTKAETEYLIQMFAVKSDIVDFDVLSLAPVGSFLSMMARHFEKTDISCALPIMQLLMIAASKLTQAGVSLEVPGIGKIKPTQWTVGLADSGSSKTLACEELLKILGEAGAPPVRMLPEAATDAQWIIELSEFNGSFWFQDEVGKKFNAILTSQQWTRAKPWMLNAYQDNLRRDAQRLCAEADNKLGKVNFCSVSQAHIESQLGKMERNPGNQRLKLWRYLTDFAFQNRIVAHKATDGIKANPEKKTAGHIPWTFEDITKFRERWPYGTRQRLAFELQFWAGARISDTRNLGPKNIDDQGWLNFVQQKTGSEVSVPMYRALPHFAETADLDQTISAIDAMPVGDLTWLATESGEVRSQKGSSQWFSRAAQQAGLKNRTSHGLRKSRMILHAENGASTKEIAAWSGHETLAEIERYIRSADRRRLLSPSALETGKFL